MGQLAEVYREALALGDAIRERLALPLNPPAVEQVIELVEARGRLLAEAGEQVGAGPDPAAGVDRLQELMHQQRVLEEMIDLVLAGLQTELQETGRSRMQLAQTGSTIRLRGPSRHLDTRR